MGLQLSMNQKNVAANYVDLRAGNRLPAVGVLQKLLKRGGAEVGVDGEFGPKTKQAVAAFQKQRHLEADGIVGQVTWPRIAANAGLAVVDFVDVFDPSLYQLEAADIAKIGGYPLMIGGACNGVAEAVGIILGAVRPGSVFLLRFHGHGAPGIASISDGQLDGSRELAEINNDNFPQLRAELQKLRPIFGHYGCVQFMHCSTGRGSRGRVLLQSVADTLGVPATAALQTQYGGGTATFMFEGPTQSAFPAGGTLHTWSASRPDLPGMSVA